ncbi:MAG: NAD(+)/NADH kinase [SAR324 cluster bacterium]|nr:NAD(+)/NADH kinase [SAR324 cluster bacterium]
MIDFNNVGLFIDNKHREGLVEFLESWFARHRIKTCLLSWDTPPRSDLDLIIAMGGDGTVLFVLGQFPNCPVLAINYGTVGFLTAGNKEELQSILDRLLKNNFLISDRSILECRYPGGSVHAVNEVVVKGITRLVSMNCYVDGILVRHIRGDGVIVGTPTGSTAYLLSVGAPIVMPEVRCIVLAGLNEYNFTSRHLILNHDAQIRIEISPDTKETEIYLSADGKNKIPLSTNDELVIYESERRAKLIFLDQHYFFNNLSSRLAWG